MRHESQQALVVRPYGVVVGEEHLAEDPLVLVVGNKANLALVGSQGVSDDVAGRLHFKEVILDLEEDGGVLPGVAGVVSGSVSEVTFLSLEGDEAKQFSVDSYIIVENKV